MPSISAVEAGFPFVLVGSVQAMIGRALTSNKTCGRIIVIAVIIGMRFDPVYSSIEENPNLMRTRRCTVGHAFGTIKAWMGSTHFQMCGLNSVQTEMALHVLAYDIKRMINMIGMPALLRAVTT